jgi:hypothetical protein
LGNGEKALTLFFFEEKCKEGKKRIKVECTQKIMSVERNANECSFLHFHIWVGKRELWEEKVGSKRKEKQFLSFWFTSS